MNDDLRALDILGHVPDGWQVIPLRRFSQVRRGTADKSVVEGERLTHLIQYTDVYYKREQQPDYEYLAISVTESEWDNAKVEADDILVTGSSETVDDIGHSTHVGPSMSDHVFGSDVICVRPQRGVLTRGYGKYLMENRIYLPTFTQLSRGVTRYRFSMDDFKNLPYALPPLATQVRIRDYLDSETARIDALVDRKQHFIDLLLSKRTVLITNVVTKGLDPDAEMKDSGIDWFGSIPSHWPVAKLGLFARVLNGSTPSRDDPAYWTDGTVPWMSSGKVNEDRVTEPSELISERALKECSISVVPAGSVLIGLVGQGRTRGTAALLEVDATVNQNVAAIIPSDKLNGRYLQYQLTHMYEPIREYGRGGNQAALNCALVAELRVPVPSVEEQSRIAQHLDRETSQIDALVEKTRRSIDLLREYHAALVSAAVTGQVDIPGTEASEEVA